MKVFITGGAGFLGYHLAHYLAGKGDANVLYDIADADLSEYPEGTVAVKRDIRDAEALGRALEEHAPDLIVAAAAALPLWKPLDIFTTNVTGTRTTLRLAKERGIDRVVFISSTAVYGVPETHPLYETDPLIGVGPYGISKIEAEEACAQAREGGLCVPVVRPKTFIGTARLGVFQILYDWVEDGVRIPMIGDGTNRYQLLEVDDLCSAIHLTMVGERDKVTDVFNVGAGEFGTGREDMGALCEHAASGSSMMATPAAVVKPLLWVAEHLHLSPLYKWVYGTADKDSFVSTDKIRDTLGWAPEYSNADALIRAYDWYLEHKHEIAGATGVTHRVAWRQGALGLVKKALKTRR